MNALKSNNPELNITWMVIVSDRQNSKKLLNKLYRAGIYSIADFGNGYYSHFGNKEKAIEFANKAVSIMQSEGRNGNIHFITDKQMGMSKVNYGGKGIVENIDPFKHSIILTRKGTLMQFPISEKQLSESIVF